MLSTKEVFNADAVTIANVNAQEFKYGKSRTKYVNKLFQSSESISGGLDMYEKAVSDDLPRQTKELRYFENVVQKKIDEDNGFRILQESNKNCQKAREQRERKRQLCIEHKLRCLTRTIY